MAATLPIRLDLPAELYARIEEEAAHSEQSVEAVLIESLALLFGVPFVDWDHLAATLETLSDVQLWAVVYRRLASAAAGRLRELTARAQQAPLSTEEQAELAALIDEADRMTLLRSHALLVLQQRGHDVREQLQRGA
jgi:hypothetical protein